VKLHIDREIIINHIDRAIIINREIIIVIVVNVWFQRSRKPSITTLGCSGDIDSDIIIMIVIGCSLLIVRFACAECR
jgi:hypothetical protein